MERRRYNFTQQIKHEVKTEQKGRCAYCGTFCNGRHDSNFQVHHVVPQALGGSTERANAIGLCGRCHTIHDENALCQNRLIYETMLEEGRDTEVTRLAHLAGIPITLLDSPKALREHLSRADAGRIARERLQDRQEGFVSFYDSGEEPEWGQVEKTGQRYRRR